MKPTALFLFAIPFFLGSFLVFRQLYRLEPPNSGCCLPSSSSSSAFTNGPGTRVSVPPSPSSGEIPEGDSGSQRHFRLGFGLLCKETYERVINRKLATKFVLGKSVMMDFHSVEQMCELLGDHRDKDVLEWGCGGSTLFFSQFARSWISIEHDASFGEKVSQYAGDHGLPVKVELVGKRPSSSSAAPPTTTTTLYRNYTDAPVIHHPGRKYDIVLDDGIERVDCADSVLLNNLLKPGGVLVIHDFERKAYHAVFDRGWTLVKLINTDRRHLAILQTKKFG
jgi:hypothetical protein